MYSFCSFDWFSEGGDPLDHPERRDTTDCIGRHRRCSTFEWHGRKTVQPTSQKDISPNIKVYWTLVQFVTWPDVIIKAIDRGEYVGGKNTWFDDAFLRENSYMFSVNVFQYSRNVGASKFATDYCDGGPVTVPQ
jgi:hypothetical protein